MDPNHLRKSLLPTMAQVSSTQESCLFYVMSYVTCTQCTFNIWQCLPSCKFCL